MKILTEIYAIIKNSRQCRPVGDGLVDPPPCPSGIAAATAMEEQFILRVPPSVAERIERLMNESAAASSSNPDDTSLDLSFSGQRRPRLSPSNPALLCAKTYRALG